MTQIMVTVDSVSWAAVVCPINAKQVIFYNAESGAQDILRRIDSANSQTQLTIPAGSQAVWRLSDDPRNLAGMSQFRTGKTVAYLKSTTGSFNVAVEFMG